MIGGLRVRVRSTHGPVVVSVHGRISFGTHGPLLDALTLFWKSPASPAPCPSMTAWPPLSPTGHRNDAHRPYYAHHDRPLRTCR
jgi:hypothetical protein